MRTWLKILLCSVLSFLIFAAGCAAIVRYDGFNLLELRYYRPRVISAVEDRLGEVAAAFDSFYADTLFSFTNFASQESVRSHFRRTADDALVRERTEALGLLQEALPGLGVRLVESDGRHVHFSTFGADILRRDGDLTAYKPYDEVSDVPFASVAASSAPRLSFMESTGMLVFSVPLSDAVSGTSGTLVFFVPSEDFTQYLVSHGIITLNQYGVLVSPEPLSDGSAAGIVFGFPSVGQELCAREVVRSWSEDGGDVAPLIVRENGGTITLITSHASSLANVGWLCDESDFTFSKEERALLLASSFIVLYLLVFFLLNLKHEPSAVIRKRMQKFSSGLIRKYRGKDWAAASRELEARRQDAFSEIQRSLGRIARKHPDDVKFAFDQSWSTVILTLGGSSQSPAVRKAPPAPSARVAPAPADMFDDDVLPADEVSKFDATDEVAELGAADEVEELDSADEVTELDAADEVTELDAADAVAELDAADEVAELDAADEVAELDSADEVAELDAADEVTELDAADEVAEFDAADEVTELGAADEVAELDAADEVTELDTADEVAELDAADEVAELDAADEVAELDAADEVTELGAADAVAELDSADEVAELDAADEVAELDAAEEVAELDAADEVSELDAADEVAELDAADEVAELGAADEVAELGAADEVAELDSADEVADLDAADEVADLDAADEVAELDAADEVEDLDAADEVVGRSAEEPLLFSEADGLPPASMLTERPSAEFPSGLLPEPFEERLGFDEVRPRRLVMRSGDTAPGGTSFTVSGLDFSTLDFVEEEDVASPYQRKADLLVEHMRSSAPRSQPMTHRPGLLERATLLKKELEKPQCAIVEQPDGVFTITEGLRTAAVKQNAAFKELVDSVLHNSV